MSTIEQHQQEYREIGLTVVPDAVPRLDIDRWVSRCTDLAASHGAARDQEVGGREGEYGPRRRLSYTIVDGVAVAERWPEMMGLYAGLATVVRLITGHPIILSPYPQSAVVAKVYRGAGAEHGWHFDTNVVTGLLYLTTHPASSGDGATEYVPARFGQDTSQSAFIWPTAGDLLVMRGRDVFHRVPRTTSPDLFRITIPLNYYTPTDTWRPTGIDTLHFGKTVPKGA
jgi:hypothetical protein